MAARAHTFSAVSRTNCSPATCAGLLSVLTVKAEIAEKVSVPPSARPLCSLLKCLHSQEASGSLLRRLRACETASLCGKPSGTG